MYVNNTIHSKISKAKNYVNKGKACKYINTRKQNNPFFNNKG